MSALRPGTASRLKSAQQQNVASSGSLVSRITTGHRPIGSRGGIALGGGGVVGGGSLNTTVRVDDRPITQQGLSGLRTAMKGSRRQVEDKSHFLGLLRNKMNEINDEINSLNKQTIEKEEDNASFVQYEQMAEKLALEIRDLQGELGDYNTLVDKATSGDNMTNVELDKEEIRTDNERSEKMLESLFEQRQQREQALKAFENELLQEEQMSEALLQEMNDEDRAKYYQSRELNAHLLNQLTQGNAELEQLEVRRAELEEDLANSQVKQEAMRIYTQLHEAEKNLSQLQAEDAVREDPQRERENLLQQVREDNKEIVSMERQTKETQEKVSQREEELNLLEQDLDDNRSERSKKYRELKKREQQIDEFLQTFDEAQMLEQNGVMELGSTVVQLLESASRHTNNANQIRLSAGKVGGSSTTTTTTSHVTELKDQLQFKSTEVTKSEKTANALLEEKNRLNQDLIKIEQLESKVTQELETLQKRIATMEKELTIFSDLDKVKDDADSKRKSLISERERLEIYHQNLHQMNQTLTKEQALIQTSLANQDTNVQLGNLERRWAQHEQVNFGLREAIATKRLQTDHTNLAKQAMDLVHTYNEALKLSLSNKPVIA